MTCDDPPARLETDGKTQAAPYNHAGPPHRAPEPAAKTNMHAATIDMETTRMPAHCPVCDCGWYLVGSVCVCGRCASFAFHGQEGNILLAVSRVPTGAVAVFHHERCGPDE